MGRLNIHAYPSPIVHESRMFKETKALANSGLVDRVVLVGTWDEGLREVESIDERREIWRIRLGSRKLSGKWGRAIQIVEWQLRVLWRLRRESVAIFNAHNLATLPLGAALKLFSGARLIYDTHELETRRSGWPALLRGAATAIERACTPIVDATFVVSDSIAGWYRLNRSFSELHVIRNYPDVAGAVVSASSTRPLRETFGIRDDELLFIYQGVIGEGRCIDLMLEIFARVDGSKHLVLMGFFGSGNYQAKIDEYTSRYPNIHFHQSVSPQEVLGYTRSADVGLYLIQEVSLSYRLTVGNKFYEYLVCGVPVITSAFPDVSRVIDEYGCGWKVETEAEEVYALIQALTLAEVRDRQQRAAAIRTQFVWQTEETRMLDVYARLLREAPA